MVTTRAAAVALVALAACTARKAIDAGAAADDPVRAPRDVDGTAEPLPPAQPTVPIGEPGPMKLIAADDAGAWQVLCDGTEYTDDFHMQVVVGGGAGFAARGLLATASNDLLVVTDTGPILVDVAARTTTKVRAVAGAIDDATRRVVLADGDELVVRDPGKAPRRVKVDQGVKQIVLRTPRWALVSFGSEPSIQQCTDARAHYLDPNAIVVDLDPSGVEAVDRVGPEIGITAAGEITLRGEIAIGPECMGDVVAALADPPRALAYCRDGRYLLAAPGAPARRIGSSALREATSSTIDENLILGQRIVCVWGACIDLVDGDWFSLFDEPLVIYTAAQIVRKQPTGLAVDDVVTKVRTVIALPQIAQTVTVDAVTGRRRTGAPPPAELAAIDLSGSYLLYGRFVVDLAGARVTQTLTDDAVAVDRTGRALVAASLGQGPLRWVSP